MGSEVIYRLVAGDTDPARLRRLKVTAGHQLAHIPLPGGRRVVYTTAAIPGASVCEDVPLALSRDFAEMPNDARRRFLSENWRRIVADAKAEAATAREPWEYLGRVGRSLEHVELAARDLAVLVGRTDDLVVIEAMAPEELGRFLRLIRCRGPWQEWGEDKTRRAA